MTPSNESSLYSSMQIACSTLTDHGMFSAYPQLSGPMYSFSSALMNTFTHQLQIERSEALHGLTPWAKLYKMMTGNDIQIPLDIVDNYVSTGRVVITSSVPIKAILDYFLKYRQENTTSEITYHGDGGLSVQIGIRTGEVIGRWRGNDMTLRLGIGTNHTEVVCPLFHAPYEILLKPDFIETHVTVPLFREIVGDEAMGSFEKDHLAMDHVCREIEVGETLHEDNYAMRLMNILGDFKGFCNNGDRYVRYVVNDHRITLRLNSDMYTGHGKGHNFKGLCISEVAQIVDEGKLSSVYNWEKNPLLVRDILSSLNPAIRKFVEQHEQETEELLQAKSDE